MKCMTFAAFLVSSAFFLSGCLKERPVVEAPVAIDIPRPPPTGPRAAVPAKQSFKVSYAAPPGWRARAAGEMKLKFDNLDKPDASFVLQVYQDDGGYDPEFIIEGFRKAAEAKGWSIGDYDHYDDWVTLFFYSNPGTVTPSRQGIVLVFRLQTSGSAHVVMTSGSWPKSMNEECKRDLIVLHESVKITPDDPADAGMEKSAE